jgi:ABC-type polysaccharide/polyol phosphate transport system ATPase subunit
VAEPAIVVDRLSKRFRLYHERNQYLKAAVLRGRRSQYEEFWALRDVSFEVRKGEAFGIIGENGSGKSTLLKCLAQILTPDAGSISHDGTVSALLELGAGFHPELSGKENVYLNGAILGLSKKQLDRKFDEIVEFAGLERFIDTPVKNYSSGMYVRLGFAVAVNVDPDILVIDEVLAVGDENFQRKCAEKIAEFREDGRTIVLVSHGLGQVATLCDRAAWLSHGHVEAVGPPIDVINTYAGTVHEDSHASAHGTRWGSGEIRVTSIELLDERGAPIPRCHTGDRVTLRLRFTADEAIARPVFGIDVFNIEGVHVTGPNTRHQRVIPDVLHGTGHVDVSFDPLVLLPGTYDVSTSIHDHNGAHCFDTEHLAFRFDVLRGEPAEEAGVVTLRPRWRVQSAADEGAPAARG